MQLFPHQLPWFIVGSVIGLVPATLYAMINRVL